MNANLAIYWSFHLMNNKFIHSNRITKIQLYLTVLAACLFLAGCSNKSIYQSIQSDGIRECNQKVYETVRAECLSQYKMSFKDYERKRLEDNDEK